VLNVGFVPGWVTDTPVAVGVGHFPGSVSVAVMDAQLKVVRFNPVMVQVVELITFVLFMKTPSAYRFMRVPVEETQVPETEVVLGVMLEVVMVGTFDEPAVLY
jgi:hypothetical protein